MKKMRAAGLLVGLALVLTGCPQKCWRCHLSCTGSGGSMNFSSEHVSAASASDAFDFVKNKYQVIPNWCPLGSPSLEVNCNEEVASSYCNNQQFQSDSIFAEIGYAIGTLGAEPECCGEP